jgi:superfamily II helicase
MTDKMPDKEFRALENETLDLFRKYNHFVIPNKITKTSNRVYTLNATCPFCKKENNYKNLLVYNKNFYSINSICRHCLMKFILVSPMKKLAYKLYPITRRVKDVLNKINSKRERTRAEKIKNRIKTSK